MRWQPCLLSCLCLLSFIARYFCVTLLLLLIGVRASFLRDAGWWGGVPSTACPCLAYAHLKSHRYTTKRGCSHARSHHLIYDSHCLGATSPVLCLIIAICPSTVSAYFDIFQRVPCRLGSTRHRSHRATMWSAFRQVTPPNLGRWQHPYTFRDPRCTN